MITFDEARAFVLAGCARNATELLGLNEARGSVTAQEVVAAEQVPPFANTAVDGYAAEVAVAYDDGRDNGVAVADYSAADDGDERSLVCSGRERAPRFTSPIQ